MARFNKLKPVPSIRQESELKRKYNEIIDSISTYLGELQCEMRLQPTSESRVYKVRIRYNQSWASPKVWLIDPSEFATVGGVKPPHVYSDGTLCVFFPKAKEWDNSMFLAESFVPWIITWLSAYEYWQITGEWLYPEREHAKKNDRFVCIPTMNER